MLKDFYMNKIDLKLAHQNKDADGISLPTLMFRLASSRFSTEELKGLRDALGWAIAYRGTSSRVPKIDLKEFASDLNKAGSLCDKTRFQDYCIYEDELNR